MPTRRARRRPRAAALTRMKHAAEHLAGSALRALRVNKLRSALTMLGIVIGVGAVITMIAVGAGAQRRVAEQIRVARLEPDHRALRRRTPPAACGWARARARRSPRTTPSAIEREIPTCGGGAGGARQRPGDLRQSQLVHRDLRRHARRTSRRATGRVAAGRVLRPGGGRRRRAKVALLGQTVAQQLFGDADPVGPDRSAIKQRALHGDRRARAQGAEPAWGRTRTT